MMPGLWQGIHWDTNILRLCYDLAPGFKPWSSGAQDVLISLGNQGDLVTVLFQVYT